MSAGHEGTALVAERFEVGAQAGAGGMGAVFRARDRATGEQIALKVLTPRARADAERFLREATTLAALSHPSIVRYVAHGLDEDGRPYLAMEWLDGEDLSMRLGRGPLSPGEARALGAQVADALALAHERGVVHRDVKPSNVFLVGGDVRSVRVLDFGVARLAGAAAMTGTGVLVGTPAYMAPEQARGGREIDARADLFALGAVLYECLTGAPAFHGDNLMAILARVLLEPSRPPSEIAGVSPELDRLVLSLLEKDPGARPPDARAVCLALGREDAPPSAATPRSSFGAAEREWTTLVFARDPSHHDTATAATLAPGERDTLAHAAERARSLGATLARLVDGTLVAELAQKGSPKDRAVTAAKCALALHATLGEGARIAVATGRGVRADRAPLGEVIDVAARLLALPAAASGPRLDAATASLLDAGFELGGDADGLTITAERALDEAPRMLLGRPAPFVGRDREVATVMGLVDEAISEGAARAILLTAPAGTGKSRLRKEIITKLTSRGDVPPPLIARGDALGAGSPHGALVKLVACAAGLRDGEPGEVTRQKLGSRVSQRLGADAAARVTAFFAELVGAPFDGDVVPELVGARLDAAAMGDQVLAAWEDFLVAETSSGPLVLVLEDLHWSDAPSVKACDYALRRLRDRPLVVLATARPEVHQVFPSLWAGRDVHEVALVPLSQRASERFVRSVLGDAASDAAITRITSRAEGNAFVLEELVRARRGPRRRAPRDGARRHRGAARGAAGRRAAGAPGGVGVRRGVLAGQRRGARGRRGRPIVRARAARRGDRGAVAEQPVPGRARAQGSPRAPARRRLRDADARRRPRRPRARGRVAGGSRRARARGARRAP
ncbi:MAG: protein kinase [Polyangiaceae bacterium]|nr:protein kinase [Polyangiaceae bacterium]